MTIIHEIKDVDVKKFGCCEGEQSSINFREGDCLKGIDEIWYYYFTGSYEGNGVSLLRKGYLYTDCNLGHCSCDWPENIIENVLDSSYMKLDVLKASFSNEYAKAFEPIFEFINGNK